MSVEFLLGPAGSGKTFRCLEQVRSLLEKAPEGPPLVFLAPKQATFQIERRLLLEFGVSGYHRLQIVPFERLTLFLLERLGITLPESLSEEGRVMVIRSLLLRHGAELSAFAANAQGTGFARALSGWLRELQQHQGRPASLREIAGQTETPMGLRAKLRDAALILERYEAWLNERKINDPDVAMPLATETLKRELSQSTGKPIGWVWMDGFAELTPAELTLLEVVVRASEGATLAFCLPDSQPGSPEDIDLWCNVRGTFRSCFARLSGATPKPPRVRCLPEDFFQTRFAANPILSHLESQLAKTSPQTSQAPDERLAPHLQLWSCANPEAEAELAAQVILQHVQEGGKYRDIGIIPRSLQGYASAYARVFRRYQIPLFIDQRAAIGHHPAIELIRAALRTLVGPWSSSDLFAILKTGLAVQDHSAADRLENLALRQGWTQTQWQGKLTEPLTAEMELARNRLVDPLLRLAIDTGDMPNGTVMAGALAALLAALKVESQLDSWYLANPDAPHNTVWKALVSWAENIKLAFAQDRLSLADWAEIFESGLLGLSVGVLPAALDQVLLGPVDRSRNPELKIVFVPGLNDGVFPARPPAPQILGQHETLWLELKGLGRSGVSLGRMAHERFFAYIALTRSSRQVIASWSSAGAGGEALEPSAVVRQLRQIFPNSIIRGPGRRGIAEFRHPAQWLFAGIAPPPSTAAGIEISRLPLFTRATDAGWHAPLPEDRLRPTVTLLRGQPALRFSPSQLESFANCPFQYFAQYGLRCEERPLFEADSRDRGSFEHAILATFHRLVMQRGERWRDLSPREVQHLITEAVASELQREDRDAFSRTPASLYRTQAVQDRLAGLVTRLIAGMASHAFDPVDVEVPVMISPPPDSNTSPTQAQIQGRLDRIDRAVDPVTGREYLLVSDYKSRARTFDHEKFHAGTDIQAPLYAAATVEGLGRRHRGQPAGWVWVPLHTKLERGGSRTEFAETKNKPWLRGRLTYDALSLLQTHEVAESPFSLKLKKDGQPVATADLRSDTEFTAILQDAVTIAHGLANMILQGRAEPAPLQFKGTIPCDYCRARDVCRFDMTITQPRTAPLFALPQPLC